MEGARLQPPIISFRDVHLTFERPILQGVSFDLQPGTTKIVLGGSGSGKTTILRLILGLLKPEAGSIRVDGSAVRALLRVTLRHPGYREGIEESLREERRGS